MRKMEEKDITAIINGEKEVFGRSLGYDMLYSELHLNPYAYYFVLEIDKEVCGYIGLWINENTEIINFYIEQKYQGQGYGKLMLEFVIKLSIKCKVNNISLEVRKSNERAISLYKKYGFIKSHTRKKYYEDGEDAIIMIKFLRGAK